MADKTVNIQASTPVEKEKDFRQVHDIVVFHRSEVARKVNTEMLQMAWEIGQYISARIKSAGWGAKVVDELSKYLQQQEPGSRGFGRRNLYNMVTFYDKYSTPEFCEIAKSLTNSLFVQHKTQSEIVQMPSAQIENLEIMQMPSATTREQALNQVAFLLNAKRKANKLGNRRQARRSFAIIKKE